MSVWTVKPEAVKVDLTYTADGTAYPFSVFFKRRLSIGETRRIQTAGWRGTKTTEVDEQRETSMEIDWKRQSFARVETYLVSWSLQDEQGAAIPLTRDAIEALDPDVFALIETALNTHVEAMAAEKKPSPGGLKPSAT